MLLNSSKSYADFPAYVKKMKTVFHLWASDDFTPTLAISVLLKFFESDLFDFSMFNVRFRRILNRFDKALTRQLPDFLEGGVFGGEIDPDVKNILSTCPMTNLTGERLFGDLDFCMNKRRHASTHLRSIISMLKHNGTMKWLSKQSGQASKNLLKKARKYGPVWRNKSRQENEEVLEKIKSIMTDKKQAKDKKEMKKKESTLAAINAIIEQGKVVTTKEDELFNGPQPLLKLQQQIRYRKVINGEKLIIKGTKQMLYDRLLEIL